MTTFYNDVEPSACAWLKALSKKNLISPGDVSETPIQQLNSDDLTRYTQCHFFAGIGGWSYALRLAGWPDDVPVWTGSCPCQPFSTAGAKRAEADKRHLWPEFRRLISECKPPVVFGEQVASKRGRDWLAGVRAELERTGYEVGAADLCAAGVGAPHRRQRLFWVAYTKCERRRERFARSFHATHATRSSEDVWSGEYGGCADGRQRRFKSGIPLLVDGVSAGLGRSSRLRGYGNAIVPQVAAAFVKSFVEAAL